MVVVCPRHRGLRVGISDVRGRLEALVRNSERVTLATMCDLGVECLGLLGMSIALVTKDTPQSALVASDDDITSFEDLQFTLGVGPGMEAHRSGRAVIVDDLDAARSRWPDVMTAARQRAIGGIAAFPVQVGAIKLGVVSLYRATQDSRNGELTGEGFQLAEMVGEVAMDLQLDAAGESFGWALREGTVHRAVVHQATGMVAAQLGSSVEDAFVRLRAHAFTEGRPVLEVAQDVLDRRVRFST